MTDNTLNEPAAELARASGDRCPKESETKSRASTDLMAEEIELRRHIDRLGEQRRRCSRAARSARHINLWARKGPARSPICSAEGRRGGSTTTCSARSASGTLSMCKSMISAWAAKCGCPAEGGAGGGSAFAGIERARGASSAERGCASSAAVWTTTGEFSREYQA